MDETRGWTLWVAPSSKFADPLQEAEYLKRPEVKIVIPDVLKLQLVDDWENVTKNNQLVTLPRKPNVRELLEEYREYVNSTKKERST